MLVYEFPPSYVTSVASGSDFHKNNKTWSGKGTLQYYQILKDLVEKLEIKTVLDFGSGKGVQYSLYELDKKLNIEVECYDPCLHGLENWPSKTYDMIMALDVVTNIDKKDISWLYQNFLNWANKCVIIGTHLDYKGKNKKRIINSSEEIVLKDLFPENVNLEKFYIVDHLKIINLL